jgi:hypothetical protein
MLKKSVGPGFTRRPVKYGKFLFFCLKIHRTRHLQLFSLFHSIRCLRFNFSGILSCDFSDTVRIVSGIVSGPKRVFFSGLSGLRQFWWTLITQKNDLIHTTGHRLVVSGTNLNRHLHCPCFACTRSSAVPCLCNVLGTGAALSLKVLRTCLRYKHHPRYASSAIQFCLFFPWSPLSS